MALIDYTSFAEIRATLGVSSKELSDSTLSLKIYETYVKLDLESISDTLDTRYLAILATVSVFRTVKQQRFVDLTQLFSAYSASKNLITSLVMFSPKRITDGKAEVERFSDPLAEVRLGILANYATLRAKLSLAHVALGGTVVLVADRSYAVASGLARDPVTGA